MAPGSVPKRSVGIKRICYRQGGSERTDRASVTNRKRELVPGSWSQVRAKLEKER